MSVVEIINRRDVGTLASFTLQAREELCLADPVRLAKARVHEAMGDSADMFAVLAASRLSGPIIWIGLPRDIGSLAPTALQDFIDPARIILTEGISRSEVLWAAEQALRAACAPCVVIELSRGPNLRESRRLQIAAEEGGGIGILLIHGRAHTSAGRLGGGNRISKGAAWALARFGGHELSLAPTGQTGAALAALPVEALRLPQKITSDLRRTGLQTIGQLTEIKRAELARRFGLDLTQSLSAALGHSPDPVSPKAADPIYAARMTLPDPIGFQADLLGVLERLTSSVCRRLAAGGKGARRYYLTVRCVDTGDHMLYIGFARPTHETRAVLQQFRKPLDGLKIEFGADWFRLEAAHIEPIQPFQISLDQHKQAEDDTSKIISTLGNRLGFDRVRQFMPVQSHLPEREFTCVEAMDRREPVSWTATPRRRPVRLFRRLERLVTLQAGRPPKRFQWRKSIYATQDAKGPERLSAEWWQDDRGAMRDYWQVQTEDGPRLWLMTYPGSAEPNWYIAGRFA